MNEGKAKKNSKPVPIWRVNSEHTKSHSCQSTSIPFFASISYSLSLPKRFAQIRLFPTEETDRTPRGEEEIGVDWTRFDRTQPKPKLQMWDLFQTEMEIGLLSLSLSLSLVSLVVVFFGLS